MADTKLTGLTATTSSTGDDLIYIVDNPGGTPTSYKITKDNFFKFTDGAVISDSNGNEILKIVATNLAVNEITFKNGATGSPATIYTTGGDTNIGLLLTGKGTGQILIGDATDSTKRVAFNLSGATSGAVMTFTASPTTARTITFPDATDTLVGRGTTDTLTNKTLTSPVISSISNTGTLTLPTSTDTLVGRATSDTLTNKTLTDSTTTFQDETDNSKKMQFQLSGITTANTRTLTIPDASTTLVGTDTTQTLTNKTLTFPAIDNIKTGYTTTTTAAGTTTLTSASNNIQRFTGTTTQTVQLPVTSTLATGVAYQIQNVSTGSVTVNSSGGNLVTTVSANSNVTVMCIGTSLTTAADWYVITGGGGSTLGTQDVWIPARAMDPRATNGAEDGGKKETSTNKINYSTWDFDTTTQEFMQFTWQPPRNYNNGTVKFTPYWTAASGTGGVVWACQGVALSDNDGLDSTAFGTEQTSTDTFIAAAKVHVAPQSTAITIAGTPADSDLIIFQVKRNPSNASDTLGVDAQLIGVMLEYTIDSGVTS